MKHLSVLVASFMWVFLFSAAQANEDEKYQTALKTFKESPQVSTFFNTAYGYAVFPTIGKAGVGVGGAHGKGRVYEQGVHVGNTSMTQLSIGFQLGGKRLVKLFSLKPKQILKSLLQVILSLVPRLVRWPLPPAQTLR